MLPSPPALHRRPIALQTRCSYFLCSEDEGKLSLWNTRTGQRDTQIELKSDFRPSIDLTLDGNVLAVSSNDGHIYIHDLKENKIRHKLLQLEAPSWGGPLDPTFSPDGKALIAFGPRSLRQWDSVSGKLVREITTPRGPVAFAPDGKSFACGARGRIRLFDAASGKEVSRVEEHVDDILALNFTADGKRLVSGHGYSIGLWDVATGKRLNRSEGHYVPVTRLAFSPDGKSLVSGAHGEGGICPAAMAT